MLIRVSDIIILSFGLYKEHFKLFARYLGLLFIPTAFVQLSGEIVRPLFINEASAGAINAIIGVSYLTLVVIAFIFGFWITLSMIKTCSDLYQKTPLKTIHDELGETKHYLWPALLTAILSTAVFAVWFSPIIIKTGLDVVAFAQYLTNAQHLLIFMICMVPAIYFGLWYMFATYNVVIQKEHSVLKAMRDAHNMVLTRWWPVLWRLGAPWIVFSILAIIPQKLLKVTQFFTSGYVVQGSWEHIIVMNLIAIVFIASSLLFTPLGLLSKTILYCELKKLPTRRQK